MDSNSAPVFSYVVALQQTRLHVQVVVRLLVAPYGNAGVSTDPEAEESNYQTHPPERVRRAPLDDLMGMVREPSDDPERGEVRAVATTDQMELQVIILDTCAPVRKHLNIPAAACPPCPCLLAAALGSLASF